MLPGSQKGNCLRRSRATAASSLYILLHSHSSFAKLLIDWCREGESNPHEVALGGF